MPFIISKSTSEPLGQLPSHLLAISLGHTHTHIHKKKKKKKMCKCEGPHFSPKVTVHSATVNSKKPSKCKK